jgi:hypothetical protein
MENPTSNDEGSLMFLLQIEFLRDFRGRIL